MMGHVKAIPVQDKGGVLKETKSFSWNTSKECDRIMPRLSGAMEECGPLEKKYQEIIADLRTYLEYLKEMGIEALPLPVEARESPRSSSPRPSNPLTLEVIRNELGDCRRCKLHRTRKTIVFGEGDTKATLMFVGEGPGFDEDVQGRPFVGRAGQLLTKIIQSIGLQRSQVYIANIVKCRPPQNRNPEPDEIDACHPFLLRQIEALQPQIICALGTFAAQTLLKTSAKITALRGQVFELDGIKVIPTYHPAFLLRNPEKKKDVWEDMKKILELLRQTEEPDRPAGDDKR
jgi:uracil-DNA glycosylase family 4